MKLSWKHAGRVAHHWPKWSGSSKLQSVVVMYKPDTRAHRSLPLVSSAILVGKRELHTFYTKLLFFPCLHFDEAEA